MKRSKACLGNDAKSGAIPTSASPTSTREAEPTDYVARLRQEAQEKFGEMALTIAEAFPAAVLTAISGATFQGAINAAAFKPYLDNVLAASGEPSDPIEAMLVQQLLWAHHQVGNLVSKAAKATTLQEVEVYNQALAHIMAEFRRSSLALREYRAGSSPRQVTVVKQQNIAAGDQSVAIVDGAVSAAAAAENTSDIKLETNHGLLSHAEFPADPFSTADRRALEPIETPRRNAPRPREIATSGLCEPTLAVRNGTTEQGGKGQVGC